MSFNSALASTPEYTVSGNDLIFNVPSGYGLGFFDGVSYIPNSIYSSSPATVPISSLGGTGANVKVMQFPITNGQWGLFLTDCRVPNYLVTQCQWDFGSDLSTLDFTVPSAYVPPVVTAPKLGISFFKPATDTSYKPTTFIDQSARAMGATTDGLGPVVAVVGGIIFAIGLGMYLVGLFSEVDDKKIKK
ncbi:MAG: hypothetical protein WCJ62_13400 [Flavobacterium sp.]